MTVTIVMILVGIVLAAWGYKSKSPGFVIPGSILFTLGLTFLFPNFSVASRQAFEDSWESVKKWITTAFTEFGQVTIVWLLVAMASALAVVYFRSRKVVIAVIGAVAFIVALMAIFPNFGSAGAIFISEIVDESLTWMTTAFTQPDFSA